MDAAERASASEFIASARRLQGEGCKEAVLIRNLVSHLPQMFPKGTPWIAQHIRDAESQVAYGSEGGQRRAFIDSLVGYTTIEYEHDLRKAPVFDTGFTQVRQHVAGLINAGAPEGKVVGVLSDTVRWRAFRIESISESELPLGPDDIELEGIETLELDEATDPNAERFIDFLARFLGRDAAQRLAASTIASDLGFESAFGDKHLAALSVLVTEALHQRPEYAAVVERLWVDFVAYVGDGREDHFNPKLYSSELYVVTLAKLLCANVIARQALHSDDLELAAILDGGHFQAKGLMNLVEYDYFGWLNNEPYVASLIPVAREMQRGLRTYDFAEPAAEDLFGQLLAQLATRTQRQLLGQEWTPPWLAARIARRLIDALPPDEPPRFIDMCCGCGSMLVETVKLARARLGEATDIGATARAQLTQVATGFDVDPLAVMLAKVNWVAASREWLAPFDGSRPVSIPIYLADSMFAKTPIGDVRDEPNAESYLLSLHGRSVSLPAFLVSPQFRAAFDALVERGHAMGMEASLNESEALDPSDIGLAVDEALAESMAIIPTERRQAAIEFLKQLVEALADLQRQRLNGIWAFVLRNSYRPGLVVGQFNGLISNPPWLALSKFADNPYKEALRREAEAYSIRAPGAAHLHAELATTFLLHAVDYYLEDGAVVGCILPEPITNGRQHEPFRRAAYLAAPRSVPATVDELWRVASGTFKNGAVVFFSVKGRSEVASSFPGAVVSEDASEPRLFRSIKHGASRTAWSDSVKSETAGWFDDITFRQGADVFPRTAVFHDTEPLSGKRSRISPIDRSMSRLSYLVKDVKKMADFRVTPTVVPDRYIFDVLISKHVLPFYITAPAKAFLPFERTGDGSWRAASPTRLAATPSAKAAFDEILNALSEVEGHPVTPATYFEAVDTPRRKLSLQQFPAAGYLVVFGAGGTYVSAAYAPLSYFDLRRLIIDQTLYWRIVATEDEALYITGLFNSPALDKAIAEFQPQGLFGRRHIHELPSAATPGFNAGNPNHKAVVRTTRKLVNEFGALPTDPAYESCFRADVTLSSRRRTLRTDALPKLPTYAQYAAACESLYLANRVSAHPSA